MSGTDKSNDALFEKQKDFIINMIKKYQIHPKSTLASGIVYGTDSQITFPFSNTQNNLIVQSNIKRMQNPGVGINLKKALQLVLQSGFTAENNARENAPKALILFVNKNADVTNVDDEIDRIKANGVDLIIVAINGDGKPFRAFVHPKKLFVFENADDVDKLVDPVVTESLPGNILYFFKNSDSFEHAAK